MSKTVLNQTWFGRWTPQPEAAVSSELPTEEDCRSKDSVKNRKLYRLNVNAEMLRLIVHAAIAKQARKRNPDNTQKNRYFCNNLISVLGNEASHPTC